MPDDVKSQKGTRTTQPHRKGPREPTDALAAMLKGSPAYLPNPKDVERKARKQGSKPQVVRSPLYDALIGWRGRAF